MYACIRFRDDQQNKCIVSSSCIQNFDSNNYLKSEIYKAWWEPDDNNQKTDKKPGYYEAQVLTTNDSIEELEKNMETKRIPRPRFPFGEDSNKTKRCEKNTEKDNLKDKQKNIDAAARKNMAGILAQSQEQKKKMPLTTSFRATAPQLQNECGFSVQDILVEKDKQIALLQSIIADLKKDCNELREEKKVLLTMNINLQETIAKKVQLDSLTVNYMPSENGDLLPVSTSLPFSKTVQSVVAEPVANGTSVNCIFAAQNDDPQLPIDIDMSCHRDDIIEPSAEVPSISENEPQENAEPMQTQLGEPQRKKFIDTIDFSFTPNTTQDGKIDLGGDVFLAATVWNHILQSKSPSIFIKETALALWSADGLRKRSVTGTACKAKQKKRRGSCKTGPDSNEANCTGKCTGLPLNKAREVTKRNRRRAEENQSPPQ